MPRQNAGTAAGEQELDGGWPMQAETAGETTFSLGETANFAEIEKQANQLLDYISKLSSVSDRSGHTTIHPSQPAQRRADARETESAGLRRLEKTSPSLDQERPAAEPRNQGYKAQIDELQNQLNDKDSQLNEKNTELKHLRAEITCLLGRLNDAEESAKQIEAGVQQHLEPLNQEIAALKSRLTQQEETIQVKNNALKKLEMSHRASVTALEQQARELDTQIQSQEAQLKEKLDIIQATAKKEAEMGNLIKRLSSECQKLSLELQEKTRRLNELEGKKPQAAVEAGAWRRAIGRLQEEGI
jgi:DNA repair exonuclease SbcCD ATPase subunit